MTKEILEQYIDLQKEIKGLEKRIAKIEKQSRIVSDVVQNGYKRHAVIRGVDYKRLGKLNKLKELLEQRKKQAIEQLIEIEKFIKGIENSKLRRIFEYRYYEGLNWIQIQTTMDYKHEDSARKEHDKYLKKVF